jgi:hypothetical protein
VYPGYVKWGGTTMSLASGGTELINNKRTYAYAQAAGITWLQDCFQCYNLPNAATYVDPINDPAPWYNASKPDTAGFLGLLGIGESGNDTSTRAVSVVNTITTGGVLGRVYFGPRSFLVRVLAIAQSDAALQAGLEWLIAQQAVGDGGCGGANFWFLDACPACTPDDIHPCNYYDYTSVIPPGDCVTPLQRQYKEVRFISGPNVISHWSNMNSEGALMDLELVLVAADPRRYGTTISLLEFSAPGSALAAPAMAMAMAAPADPWTGLAPTSLLPVAERTPHLALPDEWVRDTESLSVDPVLMEYFVPTVVLSTGDDAAAQVRVGIWDADGNRVDGFTVPMIPAHCDLVFDGTATTSTPEPRQLPGFAKGYDGFNVDWVPLRAGAPYTITVDQAAGSEVPLEVAVEATPSKDA